jgi:hypothetical protein
MKFYFFIKCYVYNIGNSSFPNDMGIALELTTIQYNTIQ